MDAVEGERSVRNASFAVGDNGRGRLGALPVDRGDGGSGMGVGRRKGCGPKFEAMRIERRMEGWEGALEHSRSVEGSEGRGRRRGGRDRGEELWLGDFRLVGFDFGSGTFTRLFLSTSFHISETN